MKPNQKRALSLSYDTLKLEGALLLPDLLEKAVQGQASHGDETAYQTPKGFSLQEEYGRAFRIAQAQWKAFATRMPRTDLDAADLTRQFVEEFLRDALGYADLAGQSASIEIGDRRYPIDFLAGQTRQFAIVLAPHNLGLDEADPRFVPRHVSDSGGPRKKSAFQLTQEFLNASPNHLWGLVTNGKQIRLLRDANTLTRPSFLEFDLESILENARYPDFAALWRLLHSSRLNGPNTVWESWRTEGQQEGARVRDGLREGVTQALIVLGSGFLHHRKNETLRLRLISGELPANAPDGHGYYQQLLRLVYRLIFLFAVEERGLLHPKDDSPDAIAARRIYAEGYSAARLRDRCLRRPAQDQHDDLWQSLSIVFRGLARGEAHLALPALGGLFPTDQCPDLDGASLENRDLLAAIKYLRWSNRSGTLAPVDYRNMGPEELGSVYESLLELVPDPDPHARRFGFVGLTTEGSTQGNARKTSGSYYTPDSLVQELIKSALDPVIEARVQARPEAPTEALLSITVLDPACGSGHFLLAAARRLAEKLAQLRAPEGAVRPEDYRHALREVVGHCIYGVDRNPMALELARFALWLEGFEEGRSLSFLDHHLVCGDALMGITDLDQLTHGIPDAAFKPLSGDDKAVCKALAKENKDGLKAFAKRKADPNQSLALEQGDLIAERARLEALPDDTLEAIHAKQSAWQTYAAHEQSSRLHQAADLFVGAFLAPKDNPAAQETTPTSRNLFLALYTQQTPQELAEAHQALRITASQEQARTARALHWPLVFPQIFSTGGFDCVLGNPPWERIKLQEEEFFATRHPLVATARNKAERAQRIAWLEQGCLARNIYPELEHQAQECEAEQRLHSEFIAAHRAAEAASVFAHLKADQGGRYPLSGVGDINTYAIFAETISQIVTPLGRAGFIVPSGLATDNTTKDFFGALISNQALDSFFEFENEGFFPGAGQGHMLRFALTTIVGSGQKIRETHFLFQGKRISELADEDRVFTLSPTDIHQVNPNTQTCPIFRSRWDAEITKAIYSRVPVLMRDGGGDHPGHNPWGIRFMAMFHMANDSHLFKTRIELEQEGFRLDGNHFVRGDLRFLPLYEAKMVYQYNHRHGDFHDAPKGERAHILPSVPVWRLRDPKYLTLPFYWVAENEVQSTLADKEWNCKWLLGWRDVTDARASARTLNPTVIPFAAANDGFLLMLPKTEGKQSAALLANLCALVCDFAARQKVGGLHLKYFTMKQFPVLAPDDYSDADLDFIVPRVLELTYTAKDMEPWARDLGYTGPPFEFDPTRRAELRAELDAYYAGLYGLNREAICFILDPQSVKPGYPSETFSVLKRSEEREFGEYRTARLVLREFDRMVLANAAGKPYESLLVPPPGEQSGPHYSTIGILGSEDDARLAGLLWVILRQAGALPRHNLGLALAATQTADDPRLAVFRQTHGGMLTSERLGRLHPLLQWFERTGAIRIRAQGNLIEAIAEADIPSGVIVETDFEDIAGILLAIAQSSQERLATDETGEATTSNSVRRA